MDCKGTKKIKKRKVFFSYKRGCLKRTQITQHTQIHTKNNFYTNGILLIINKIPFVLICAICVVCVQKAAPTNSYKLSINCRCFIKNSILFLSFASEI